MRALTTPLLWLGVLPAMALTACAANGSMASSNRTPAQAGMPGGAVHWGNTISAMADQYDRPRAGAVPAVGASAWVPAAPAPAYVDRSAPPPPPAPPPGGGRRGGGAGGPGAGAPPAGNNSADIPRPELGDANSAPPPAAAPAARPAVTISAADMTKGRDIFANNGCGGCHTFADGGGGGGIGPALDHNNRLSPDYVFTTVHDGRGGMPSFAGQIPDADLHVLANYIVAASKK